jgi:O-antigen ligase
LGDYLSLDAISTVQGDAQYPHNMILEVLAEGGVLALIGLAVLLTISWKRLRKNSADLGGQITLGLWLLAFGSAMTSSDIVGNRFVWVMIGVGLSLPSIIKPASFVDDERPLRLAAPST